jgi:hypothetical protein
MYKREKRNIRILLLPLILLDIALLPVSPFFAMPFSTIIIGYLLVKRYRVIFDRRVSITVFFLISCLLVSILLSFLIKDNTALLNNGVTFSQINVQKEDLKRLIYIFFGLSIFLVTSILYKNNQAQLDKYIKTVLVILCFVYIGMGILFAINFRLFYQLKNYFFNSDVNLTSNEVLINAGYFDRYNFLLLDPNNATYFILIVIFFLNDNFRLKLWVRISIWGIAFASLFLTKSTGGLVCVVSYIILKNIYIFKDRINKKYVLLATTFILCIGLVLLFDQISNNQLSKGFFETDAVQRWSNSEGSMDARLDRYSSLFEKFPPLIGSGYIIIRDGLYISPHSDHLRILYSYGILTYLVLINLLLKRKYLNNKFLFLIPAVIAFSINSLIDETRLFYTFLMLFAIANVKINNKLKSDN